MSHTASLDNTLALTLKEYRSIVDSRRFIPSASSEELESVFTRLYDEFLQSIPDEIFEPQTDSSQTISVDAKALSKATDILKILIVLKHFINKPVNANDSVLGLFQMASRKPKIHSAASEFDNQKATRRFETFITNFFVLVFDDSSIENDALQFFTKLQETHLQTVLLDAAPRVSQDEMYHQSYRSILVKLMNVNGDIISSIIKRLDSNFPETRMIDGVTRKQFLLNQLGWNQSKVYNCADRLRGHFEAAGIENPEEQVQLFEYFWILLVECKFVAVDDCCSTLFIFPSECETFLKYVNIFSKCFSQLPCPKSSLQALTLNRINSEIVVFVRKLVKAVSTNYIHFERDLNNRNYQSSNEFLTQIISSLSSLSQKIHEEVKELISEDSLAPGCLSNKLISDFIESLNSDKGNKNQLESGENDTNTTDTNLVAENSYTALAIDDQVSDDHDDDEIDCNDKRIPLWAVIIAILLTVLGAILFKKYFSAKHK